MEEISLAILDKKMQILSNTLAITNRILAILITRDLDAKKDQSLILLRCGFSPKEVAEVLGIPAGSVSKTKSRAEGRTKH